MRQYVFLIFVFAISALPSFGADGPCYRLTVQKKKPSSSTSTITVIKATVNGKDVYFLIGAYHTLVEGSDPVVGFDVIKLDPCEGDTESIYYNILEDIFIAKINDKLIDKFNSNAATLCDRFVAGEPACAVGNPTVSVGDVVYEPHNITYGCTITEYNKRL